MKAQRNNIKDLDNDHLNGKTIKIDNAKEIDYWCKLLQCEKEDLMNTIQRIGNSAKMVDDFLVLNRRKKTSNGK